MKLKALTTAILAVLLANVVLFAAPDDRKGKSKKRQTDRLVAMLPASDAAAVFDAKQLFETALPQVLSSNQQMLEHIMSHIDLIKDRMGIDVRKFDRVAVGVSYLEGSTGKTDYAPLVIASATDFNFGTFIAAAKIATNGGYRTETIAGKQVSVFKIDATKFAGRPNTNSKVNSVINKISQAEFAAVAIDRTTLIIGTLPRVRETLGGRSHLGGDIATLLAAQDTGILSFALKPPGGMAKLLPLQSDELGKTLDSIQVIAGGLKVDGNGGALHLVARTASAEDALNLRDTVEVGQSFGKIAFANKKRPDQMVYNRLINSAKIDNKGVDVVIDASIPQTDIDVLIASLKK